ncbi:MAG: hypothetical protein KatS3mg110_0620 [Pirellulaceae bacterium]|nr:MAG: hypothetical protein KatS3mg110_0614 [Pirellulaceae bacterium]GIW92579.1 MAG: hypothetical protein KatS3mg110_0620 [Pirellulaceae bacterium]
MKFSGTSFRQGLLADWEVGDRVEVVFSAADLESCCLPVPELLAQMLGPEVSFVGPENEPLEFEADANGTYRLIIPPDWQWRPENTAGIFIEYLGAGRYRLVRELFSPPVTAESTLEGGLVIGVDVQAAFGTAGCHARWGEPVDLLLAQRAAQLSVHGGFDQLICLPLVRDMELLEHQIATAKTVLRRFRGRALLCDEVGLGKTVEAGLILSELTLRGLAKRTLVLVPPSLIEQWQGEMRRKFSLDFISHDAPEFRSAGQDAWRRFDRIIASIHTAKREPHRHAIAEQHWDMLIIDEAHHLRNRSTLVWKLASQIRKQYVLLLTATPVQNHLEELFNLVTLLEPGLLSTSKQFLRRFVDSRDKMMPKNIGQLHALLAEVMVRNRRSTVGLQFTRRIARTESVEPWQPEAELYKSVGRWVRKQWQLTSGSRSRAARAANSLERAPGQAGPPCPTAKRFERTALVALQVAMGSSCYAASGTLLRLAEYPGLPTEERQELEALAEACAAQTNSSKVERLLALLDEFPDKLVVFTQFRATQEMLAKRLAEAGHEVAVFHGGLNRLAKEQAIQQFRQSARLLVCTESGSEGRNLQFAHGICNFDLPWNPMKIEQRVGRLSRIGQKHDVYVFNLVSQGTIEESILYLLQAKLNMFEMVIGEIDMVLGNLDEDREFADMVADLWADSPDDQEFHRRMEELGERLLAAKEAYLRQRAYDDRLFGDRFAPDR